MEQNLDKYASRRSASLGVVGINLGKNADTELRQAHQDYVTCIHNLSDYADYFVINISSPNTPGLRSLQHSQSLRRLFEHVKAAMLQGDGYRPCRKPVFVKIAPDDMEDEQLQDIVDAVKECDIDGIIVCNTTSVAEYLKEAELDISRLCGKIQDKGVSTGGLSGRPLLNKSTELLTRVYLMSKGEIPLIASGGVSSAEDAYTKIKNGASVVQIYSSLIFQGPQVVSQLKTDLEHLLQRDGYTNINDAVGTAIKSRI